MSSSDVATQCAVSSRDDAASHHAPRTDDTSHPGDRIAAGTDAQTIAGSAARSASSFARDPLSLLTIGGAIVFGILAALVALG